MRTDKRSALETVEKRLMEGKKIELSFVHEDEEYICISLDVFGSGKPEFIVLGNDTFHDAMVVSDDPDVNRDQLNNLFSSFPDELHLTVIPRDLYKEETV